MWDCGEDEDDRTKNCACKSCGHVGLDESDGFYYCQLCGAQADDIILTDVAAGDFVDEAGQSGLYSSRFSRQHKSHAGCVSSQCDPASSAWFRYPQADDPQISNSAAGNTVPGGDSYGYDPLCSTEPEDFETSLGGGLRYEDYHNEVRNRYIMGMQWMIQLQCEALVEKFNVSPLICGVAGTVWLRFVAATSIFKEEWADAALTRSEARTPGDPEEHKLSRRYRNEPRNAFGQRAVMVWFRDLRKKIPLCSSLAICFLACHVARAAVLPTDIVKWSIGGNLPFFSAHIEIDRRFKTSSPACPISSRVMFRPFNVVTAQRLESMSASIADYIGLLLPPVNFYEIAYRLLNHLSLPVERILPHACCIYEWSMPPDLWFSKNEFTLPSRVYVMAILLVAIRILCNLNGFGVWERSLAHDSASPSSDHLPLFKSNPANNSELMDEMKTDPGTNEPPPLVQNPELNCAELLRCLEATNSDTCDTFEYAEDLPSYLKYCKDVIFARAGSTGSVDDQEDALILKLWEIYENQQYKGKAEPEVEFEVPNDVIFNRKRAGHKWPDVDLLDKKKIGEDGRNEGLREASRETAIRDLKLDMQDNRFRYMAPRCNHKRCDYLHYERKKDRGAYSYIAHADYYILLRACARVVEVDTRIMHIGVLKFEKRLAWMEKKIDSSLQFYPNFSRHASSSA